MGGKTKQSQRTKNNVRPSSSGRSSLLLDTGKLGPGVMNVAGTELPALFPSLAAPLIDPLLSPELQMCFKKLSKKDPITKTKALQELLELVGNSKVDDVVASLPSWTHYYKLLTADPDRKVRELTQSCHGAIVSACGRRVAPHLKALMPAWLQAQYDEHAPAHTHAQASLSKTFPDSKLPEVISFCKHEIISHLVDNLTNAEVSIFIRKTDTPEEKEGQLCRVVSSSLHGLQYCTQQLPSASHAWLWEQLHSMLRTNVFWKRAMNNNSRIRAAWYSCVGRIIERYKGQFAELYGQKTLRVLVGAKETSPLAAAQLWDCLLLFMFNVEEWYKYLDKGELLSKRILDVLESGGWGDARQLAHVVLPLLAQLPPLLLDKAFYTHFFQAMFNGLDKKTILTSKSERQSWITSIDECLRYLSIQSHDFITEIVTSVHRTWLEKILADTNDGQIRTNLIKYSAAAMANLVKYWLKQAKENQSEKYDQLIRNFWQNVGATISTQIDKVSVDHDEIGRLIDGHILLLQTLKISFVQEAKKQQSIKFDGDSPNIVEKSKEIQPCDASILERYNHNLNDTVQKICGQYFEFAGTKQISSPVMTPLITLLIEFDNSSLFNGVARHFDSDSSYKFYDRVLRGWLAGDTMRCRALVDIVFLMMKHLTEEEQDALFDSFKQFPPSVVEWCISLSLSHPHCIVPSSRRWLRGPLVETTLPSVCSRLVNTGDSKAKELILHSLNHTDDGEMIVSQSAVSNILEQLGASISSLQSATLEQAACLAARLASTLNAPSLVQPLFQLSVRVPRGSSLLSLETWREVQAAWQDALAALPRAPRADLLLGAARVVHAHLRPDASSLDLKQMEHVISLCPYLLSTNSQQDISEIAEFTQTLFNISEPASTNVEALVLRHMIVKGEISCPYEDQYVSKFITEDYTKENIPELTKEDLIAYLSNFCFKAVYFRSVLLHKVDEELEDTWCNEVLEDDYIVMEFCKMLHDYCVLDLLHKYYGFWPHYTLMKDIKARCDMLVNDVINECTLKTRSHVLNVLSEVAATKGYFWAFTRRLFEIHATLDSIDQKIRDTEKEKVEGSLEKSAENVESVKENDEKISKKKEDVKADEMEALDLENMQEIVTGSGYFHTLQANDYYTTSTNTLRTKYLLMLRSIYVSHVSPGVIPRTQLLADVTADARPDVIVNLSYSHPQLMIHKQDVPTFPWSGVVSNAAVADYLALLVRARGWDLPAHHWDFTAITLCNLLTAVTNAKNKWASTKVALLTRAVLNLFVQVESFISSVKAECMKRSPSSHVAHLPTEWSDIFAPDLNQNLLRLDEYLLEHNTGMSVSGNHIAVLDALLAATRRLQWGAVPAASRGAPGAGAERAARLLATTAHYCFKYLAYELLLRLLEPMVLEDASALAACSGVEESDASEREAPPSSLQHYHAALAELDDLVGTALTHVKVCEATCSLVCGSDVQRLALGWCLLAEALARHCALARGDLHHHYIHIYRERKYLEPQLSMALRLLPAEVLAHAHNHDAPLTPAHADMFTRVPDMSVYEPASVSRWACRALYWSCVGAGAGDARGWRGAAPHKHARRLDNIVTAYISPHIVREEFTKVQQRASEIEDTDIIIHWTSYDMSAILTVDERPIELKVTLSRSHPLGLPQLVAPEHSPANNTNWLVMYMGYQNGSLLNALKMWTGAVTSKVERSPQCFVCYCRLHYQTGRLPTSYCRQCKNKYHANCLRKWFATSNKTNCPLCRAPF